DDVGLKAPSPPPHQRLAEQSQGDVFGRTLEETPWQYGKEERWSGFGLWRIFGTSAALSLHGVWCIMA
ncbi:MAG TPA: hypothetical protein VIJ30_09185, partial [Candidatus Dormibacteraeota bacterium]